MSETQTNSQFSELMFAVLRLSIGWVFFWAFIDKTFGLGYFWYNEVQFGTDPARAWISGGDPAFGFLAFGTQGKWFADFFQSLAGNPLVTFLYMFGLLGVGLAMLMGVGRKIAGASGALMMMLMWAAQLPLTHNPFMDDHVVYAIVLIILGFTPYYGRKYSLRETFSGIIEQYPFLE